MPNSPEKINIEKQEISTEKVIETWFSKEGIVEQHELSLREQEEREALKKGLAEIEVPEPEKKAAEEKAQEIALQDAAGKMRSLLNSAKSKGVAFSIEVAKGLNDPYILDLYHDVLAKDELFKSFEK